MVVFSLKAMMSILAATLSRRRPALVNAGVGFATFAAGDVLAQGSFPPPALIFETRNEGELSGIKNTSWLQSLSDR